MAGFDGTIGWQGMGGDTAADPANRFKEAFPNPYCDYATTQMPRSIYEMMWWSQQTMFANGTLFQACRRVVSYFVTGITVSDATPEEKKQYEKYCIEDMEMIRRLCEAGQGFMCFHGDTKVPTRNGTFAIRDLAGQTVDVISEGGVYRPATFKSFGRQELLEVEFSDGRTVLATPEHQWVALNCVGKQVRVPTTSLVHGYRVPRVVAARPEKNEDYFEGVRHGFVYGDGTRQNYKDLPSSRSSASYWYGFVCGFLAADGSVDIYGCAVLTQVKRDVLDAIAEQLPRLGMVGGPIRQHPCRGSFTRADGRVETYEGDAHWLTLLKRFMQPEDFLVTKHRARFEENFVESSNYGRFVGVNEVRETGIVDEVFCCVEPETHTFVIENGVLTGNCYGNHFTYVQEPFRRFLKCGSKACGSFEPIGRAEWKWTGKKFRYTCNKCRAVTEIDKPYDVSAVGERPIQIVALDPFLVRIKANPLTGDAVYYTEIDPRLKQDLKNGDRFALETTPWEFVAAALTDRLFKFDEGMLFHLHDEPPAGLRTLKWGVPPTMANFRKAYYVQVLHRYDEAIALDYVMPFRVVSPAPGTPGEDAVHTLDLQMMSSHILRMFAEHRRDPATIHHSPYPLKMDMMGADARALSPADLKDRGQDDLLNAIGVPADFYRGTMKQEVAGISLRLMERGWSHLVDGMNSFLAWVRDRVSAIRGWGKVTIKLEPLMLADNLERRQILMQLVAAGRISEETAYQAYNIDPREERERKINEQRDEAEAVAKAQKEDAKRQQLQGVLAVPQAGTPPAQAGQAAGQPGQPGQAPPMGVGSPTMAAGSSVVTPGDLENKASMEAQRIVAMPAMLRRGELLNLRRNDRQLHAIVVSKIGDIRSEARRQGGFQVLQQQFGQGAAA